MTLRRLLAGGAQRAFRACAVLAVLGVTTQVHAQAGRIRQGTLMVGVTWQNDHNTVQRVRLLPFGANLGFIMEPRFWGGQVAVVDQLSIYPDKTMLPLLDAYEPLGRRSPLVLNTLWARIATRPEVEDQAVYFGGLGVTAVVRTPRNGGRIAPMVGVGVRRWFSPAFGFELSLQCNAPRIGETVCQVPVTGVWP